MGGHGGHAGHSHDDDDEDDEDNDGDDRGESWFAGGERRYGIIVLSFPVFRSPIFRSLFMQRYFRAES